MANLTTSKDHSLGSLYDLKQHFDRVFQRFFTPGSHAASSETLVAVIPPIETWVDTEDKEFHLTMPLPGVKPEDIHINLQGNRLTFDGEQKGEDEKSGKNFLEREYSYGRFLRSVTLPDGIEGDKLTAQLKDGILEIIAPISVAALPRKIDVKTDTKAQAAGK